MVFYGIFMNSTEAYWENKVIHEEKVYEIPHLVLLKGFILFSLGLFYQL